MLGEVELTLSMSRQEVTAAVVVSKEVDDLILGIDWLGRHRCRWSFAQNLIEIDEQVVRLISRPRQKMLRRIYAVESVVVQAGHATNVPVTMALSSLRQTTGDWAVEPRSLGIGILAAGTLMRDDGRRSAVHVINVSQEDFVLGQGEFIGEAEQVTAADNEGTAWRPSEGEDVDEKEAAVSPERPVEEANFPENWNAEHIQVVIDNLPAELDFDQRMAAKKFIRDRAELFSKSDYDIGE